MKTVNTAPLSKVDSLENYTRREHIRILGVMEGIETAVNPVKFVSDMLVEVMGNSVFDKSPELFPQTQLSRVAYGDQSLPFIITKTMNVLSALRGASTFFLWPRSIRFYPDLSANLVKIQTEFKDIKTCLNKNSITF